MNDQQELTFTLEEPKEYELKSQPKQGTDADTALDTGIKTALEESLESRVDILYIGEVRDKESAERLRKAVEAGEPTYTVWN